jgi:hypothetical protein
MKAASQVIRLSWPLKRRDVDEGELEKQRVIGWNGGRAKHCEGG